jgi:uncharacterized protein involved in exopolysaccharide biosynthesis
VEKYRGDQVSLTLIFQLAWRIKVWLFLSLIISVGCAVFYSLQLPNIYRSEARIVAANETQGKASGLASQLSSVSAIAGINLGGGGEKKSVIALETMRSRQFFTYFAEKYQILTPVVAGYRWDPQSDQLLLDPELIDAETGRWIRPSVELRTAEPSMQEGYEAFVKRFGSSQDKLTGIVTVSFEFVSPKLSQAWLSLYIKEINDVMRAQDIAEAESAIKYINEQMEKTQLVEVKNLLFSLIEEHTKTLTMANARKDYVFKMIDPPYLPEVKSGPFRSVIVLLTVLVNCFLFLIFIMLYLLLFATKTPVVNKGTGQ